MLACPDNWLTAIQYNIDIFIEIKISKYVNSKKRVYIEYFAH